MMSSVLDPYETTLERLRALHRILGSWAAVGERVGYSKSYVWRVAKGTLTPRPQDLRRLCYVLCIPYEPTRIRAAFDCNDAAERDAFYSAIDAVCERADFVQAVASGKIRLEVVI